MAMCLNDMPAVSDRLPTEADVCKVASFYVDECNRIGVPIRFPKACGTSAFIALKALLVISCATFSLLILDNLFKREFITYSISRLEYLYFGIVEVML